jgi:hypothetical protein
VARITYEEANGGGFDRVQKLLGILASGKNPDGSDFTLPVDNSGSYEYKAAGYPSLATYQSGLATETAMGCQPIATSHLSGIAESLIVTYQRPI